MVVCVRTVIRLLAPLLLAATLLVPTSAPAEPAVDPSECQVVPEIRYGEPGAPGDGSPCRVAVPGGEGRYLLVSDQPWETTDVETGDRPCVRLTDPCVLRGGRTYEVSGEGPASVVPVAGAGCQTIGAAITDTWASVRPPGGAVCVDVPHDRWNDLRVMSAGAASGRIHHFATPGRRTLRLVRTSGDVDASALVAVARLDDPQGCEPLEAGSYGTSEGVDVAVPSGQVAACLTFPRKDYLLTNTVAWERAGGSGQIDVSIGNETARTCSSRPLGGPADTGSLDCRLPSNPSSNDTVTVVVDSDGAGSSWRFVRRVPGVSPGCVPAASTEPGGAATTGAVAAYVAFDCVSVEAEWTDRFVFDVTDGGTGLDLDVYNASRQPFCEEPFHRLDTCQGLLSPIHYAMVRPTAVVEETAGYALDTWKVETVDGWVPECRRVASWEEPAVLAGTLTDDHTGECLVLDDGGGALYRFSDLPPGVEVDLVPGGVPQDAYQYDDGSWGHVGGDLDAGLVLLSRSQEASREPRPYETGVECLQVGWCQGLPWVPVAAPRLSGSARVGGELVADQGRWSPDTVEDVAHLWLVDGVPVPDVDGPRLVLTPAMAGREVAVRAQAVQGSVGGDDYAVSAPVTVRPGPAPVLVEDPELRGGTRVGHLVGVVKGTWDPEVRRPEYRWRVDGQLLRETGRRIWLKPWMAGSRVTVREVAVVEGLRPGRAFVGAFRVRRR